MLRACLLVLAAAVCGSARRVGDFYPTAINLTQYIGQTVLIVGAHPDDIESTSGGTVALLTAQGTNVVYVLTTNGDKGWSKDTSMTSEMVAVTRYNEQLAAAAVLKVSTVQMLDFEDGFLNNAPETTVRERVVAAIRQYKPVAVFTWSPVTAFDMYQGGMEHPDHRTTTDRDGFGLPQCQRLSVVPAPVPSRPPAAQGC